MQSVVEDAVLIYLNFSPLLMSLDSESMILVVVVVEFCPRTFQLFFTSSLRRDLRSNSKGH